MKKGNFLIMMLAFTVASYAQQLTLTVDLCDANPAEVRMTGPWWGWDPMGGPIAADNGDGTWTITLDTPAENMEYLWVSDAVQENIIGLGCAPITDGANYANRLWEVGSGNVTADVYNSCDPCGTVIETAAVTFNVNMALEEVAESGVFVAGGAFFGAPGAYPMTDEDGDGIYSITIDLPTPFTDYYIFTNGACGDFSCKEGLAGQECAAGTWNDRLLSDITEDTVISTCFGQCTTDGTCVVPEFFYDVTFNVNMSNETVAESGVYLGGGTAFGFPGDNQMLDEDGDGTYSITMNLPEGTSSHYTFLNGNCGDWSCKEDLSGLPCGDPEAYNDRFLPAVMEATELSTCFGQCSTDGSCEAPEPTVTVNFNVDLSQLDFPNADYDAATVNGSWNGWGAWGAPMTDEDGDGIWSGELTVDQGVQYEYVVALSGPADGYGGWGFVYNASGLECALPGTNNWFFTAEEGLTIDMCPLSCASTCAAVGDPVDVTFQVDMSEAGANPAGVFVAGDFIGWDFTQMSDDDGDGIYTYTHAGILPGSLVQFKFMNGPGWDFVENVPAACGTPEFFNRSIEVGSENATTELVCYESCVSCDTEVTQYEVTFNVNMSNEEVAETGVFLAGGGNFGNPGDNQMTDLDGDGTYSITMMLDEGFFSHYTFTNGACGDWSCKENLAGLPCGDPESYNDRFLPAIEGNTTVSTCFGQCSTDGSCSSVSEASVTFQVDMNTTGVTGDVTIFGATINGWAFPGELMTDEDEDGIYEYTTTLPEGGHEYKFVNSGSDETLDSLDAACVLITGSFVNRFLTVVGGEDVVLDAVCFESCEACDISSGDVYGCMDESASNYNAEANVDDGSCLYTTNFNVDMNCAGVEYSTVHITGPLWGWTADILMADDDGDGIYSISLEHPGATVEYKYMVDYWAHQEDLVDDVQNGATCAPVTDGSSYANRVADASSTTADTYGTCLTCDEVNPPVFVDVAFAIDMSAQGDLLGMGYGAVVVNGSWNGWGAWGVELAYDWNSGLYEGSLSLEEGTEFEFVIAATGEADGWSGWGLVINAPEACSTNPELPIGSGGGNYGATAAEGLVIELCAGSCEATCPVLGCTDPFYAEFDLYATQDDGSCATAVVFGCIYDSAENYDTAANTDDGSCEFEVNDCPGDLDGDGLIATPDLLTFLSVFGTTCGE